MSIWTSVRTLGRFQMRAIAVCLFSEIASNWSNVGILFLAPSVEYFCASDTVWNDSSAYQLLTLNHTSESQCLQSTGPHTFTQCENFTYSHSQFDYTLTERFNLVCDRKWLINMASTVYMFGFLVGSAGAGMVADRFGRKPVIIGASGMNCLFHVFSAYCPQLSIYLVTRFVIGVLDIAMYTSGLVLLTEIVRKNQRILVKVNDTFKSTISALLVGAVAFLVRDYRYIHLMIASACVLHAALVALFMCESPRWLAAQNRKEEADGALRRIAEFNRKPVDWQQSLPPVAERRANFTHLFRTPNIRKRSLVLFVIWFTVVLVFYAVTYNLGSFSEDVRLGLVISSAIEAPSVFLALIVTKRLGRQITTFSLLTISAICCFCMAPLVTGNSMLLCALAIGSKVMAGNLFFIIYLYTPELYPTVIRNTGLGACSSVARVAGMSAPQISLLNSLWAPSMVVALGLASLVAAALVPLLPDTTGAELTQSVEEGEKFGADHDYGFRLPPKNRHRQQGAEVHV